jgi:hypothetical protein
LLPLIENILQPLPEELRVFRAFLQPEQFMVGYPRRHDNAEKNFLNHLFTLDCTDEDELGIRHSLVNLLAMILMGNKQSFLWTFTFHPSALQNTYGKYLYIYRDKNNSFFIFNIRIWINSASNHSNQWCTLRLWLYYLTKWRFNAV